MEKLPICPQNCLSSGDLLSCESGDNNCYCSETILYPINNCIRTRCTSSDLDIYNAYIFGACGAVDYGATTTTSVEAMTIASGTKTVSIWSADQTTFATMTRSSSIRSTSMTESSTISATTASRSASPSSKSTSTPEPPLQTYSSGTLQTPAKAGIAVGSAAASILIVAALLFLFRRHRRERRVLKGQLTVLPISTHDNCPNSGTDGLEDGGKVELAGSEAVAETRLGVKEKAELPVEEGVTDRKGDAKEDVKDEQKEGETINSAELDARPKQESEIYELASP